jgi:hypothetical protein
MKLLNLLLKWLGLMIALSVVPAIAVIYLVISGDAVSVYKGDFIRALWAYVAFVPVASALLLISRKREDK